MHRGVQATTVSISLVGLQAFPVRVEVDSGRGLPKFHIVGLPEVTVREARVRVAAALRPLDVELNEYALTVNLAPADLRKSGSAFDLAIAVGILGAVGRLTSDAFAGTVLLGELSLGGGIQGVRGLLPSLIGARAVGLRQAIVPEGNGAEAAVVPDMDVYVATRLEDVAAHLEGARPLPRAPGGGGSASGAPLAPACRARGDLCEVRGQALARRALEIAAAGEHNLLLVGPPGSGKTMLAERLSSILPRLGDEEALAVTAVHSAAGLLAPGGIVRERPYRSPHHTISAAALVGGGDPIRPGEMSLAHHGCLFLDELLEFRRHVIEAMRQPLETGEVTVCRARHRATFPARPMLVGAVNPCPCGFAGMGRRCVCTPERIATYRGRLSGPLLDRMDLQVVLPPVTVAELQGVERGESSAAVRERVGAARAVQLARRVAGETAAATNARLSASELDRVAPLDLPSRELLRRAVDQHGVSARGYVKLRRVARTLADLDGADGVRGEHFAEALQLRALDREAGSALVARARGVRAPPGEVREAVA
jgi:magnesium chelatase family protein